ncbi:mandelate racemase [Streptomyces sp. NBC_01356]|uniref:mandelate racemase/muconate lactonizing enzyme family protein n=1 Tax=Streptomyces sp. NBC_01356 TaxID=2903836 RepID=UPI002E313068|nr:enolase C-terminal domain-like protein [Streptomyces sp. NBC_01356]
MVLTASPDTRPAVTVERVETFTVALPTLRDFAVAGGGVTTRGRPATRVLVKVTASDGSTGWGEATPIPSWTYETTESIVSTLTHYLAPAATGLPLWDLDGLVRACDRVIRRGWSTGMPLARAALDVAWHDALARSRGVSLGELWGRRRHDTVELCWITTGVDAAALAESVAEGHAHGYRHFKIKTGLVPGQHEAGEVARVAAVRAAAPDARLIVDANQAGTQDSALRLARLLAPLDIAALEQPLPANDIEGLRRLRDLSPVPIAVDESLRHPTDLASFVRRGAIGIAVAKVQRCAGLTLALRQCQLAEDCGVALMGSGLTESDIGLAASLHLFAAHDLTAPADLNGRQFLQSPYATGSVVQVRAGVAEVPSGPGLGIGIDEGIVRELAR